VPSGDTPTKRELPESRSDRGGYNLKRSEAKETDNSSDAGHAYDRRNSEIRSGTLKSKNGGKGALFLGKSSMQRRQNFPDSAPENTANEAGGVRRNALHRRGEGLSVKSEHNRNVPLEVASDYSNDQLHVKDEGALVENPFLLPHGNKRNDAMNGFNVPSSRLLQESVNRRSAAVEHSSAKIPALAEDLDSYKGRSAASHLERANAATRKCARLAQKF